MQTKFNSIHKISIYHREEAAVFFHVNADFCWGVLLISSDWGKYQTEIKMVDGKK